MERICLALFIQRLSQSRKFLIREKPLAFSSLIGANERAGITALLYVTPAFRLVEQGAHYLKAAISWTATICHIIKPYLDIRLLDLVEKLSGKGFVEMGFAIVSLGFSRQELQFGRHGLPIKFEKVPEQGSASFLLALIGRIFSNLRADKNPPRHIHGLFFTKDVGVAKGHGSRPALHP